MPQLYTCKNQLCQYDQDHPLQPRGLNWQREAFDLIKLRGITLTISTTTTSIGLTLSNDYWSNKNTISSVGFLGYSRVCLGIKSRVRIIGGLTRFYHRTKTDRTTNMDLMSEGGHTGQLCNACQKINIFEMLLSMKIRVKTRCPIEVTQFSDFPEDVQPYRHGKTIMDIKSTCFNCELCFLIWNGWKAAAMEEYEMNNELLYSTPDPDTESVESDSSDENIEPALAKVALEPVYIRIMECGNGKGTNAWLDRSPRLYASLWIGSETILKC
jgi:hypothetical protein